jgi:MFS transporter, PAT family, beta-lactamase induction signal transducer AmpG
VADVRAESYVRKRESTTPGIFFFLLLPYGISTGFASITLPFFLTRAGFSVATAASIVALGVSTNIWLFLWGPIVDLTLTPRRWYLLAVFVSATTLFLLGICPFQQRAVAILTAMVFISQIAVTFVVLPMGALMAYTVANDAKGRAAGWYQAGNLSGNGIGGGAGVWLGVHYSKELAAATLSLAMIAAAVAIYFAADFRIVAGYGFRERMRLMGRDVLAMVRSAIPLLTLVLVASPIGAGAMNNIWSAVAPDWHAGPQMVALVTGVFNGIVCALGCLLGGWIADRFGRWWSYFGSGAALGLTAIIIAVSPWTATAYAIGVLVYAFFVGACYAAFSALVVHAIGRGVASTKYAICQSLGNIPVAYMTAFDGWMHDRHGGAWMLNGEAFLAFACIAAGLLVLQKINTARAERRVQVSLIP